MTTEKRKASMTFQPKMVALDIDGTIVDSFGRLPDRVHDAVQRVLAADVPVVLATGRSWLATQPIFDQLGLPPGWAVSSNGAVVVEYPPLHLHQAMKFDPAETIKRVTEIAPTALIGVEELGFGWRLSGAFPPGELTGDVRYETPEELGSRPVTRIVIRDPNRDDDSFIDMARQLGLQEVSYFIGWSAWLDIAPLGVDKAAGLTMACEALGIDPADVLAIGDGRNDIEMLRWAGRGVAIGDAPQEVKAAADAVTDPFSEGGTANELDRWFGEATLVRR